MPWIYLSIAIITEVIATAALRATDGFSKLVPVVVVITGYGVSFFFLSLTLKTIPMGITYAVWSGVGIVFITLIGYLYFKQTLDIAAIIGILLIITGVVVIYGFSKSKVT